MRQGAMLNTYPDSLGKNMGEMIEFLSMPEMKDVFQSLYLMPSVFNSDIDRGYSIITYDLAETVATEEDFAKLREMGYEVKEPIDSIRDGVKKATMQFFTGPVGERIELYEVF